ncbi:MAG: hypothetical protein ACTSWN_08735 [Promethearchaeota archaeon]
MNDDDDAPSKKTERGNSKLISLWVNKEILESWDKWCHDNGVTRTSLIITAVREYLERHDLELKKELELARLKAQLVGYTKKLENILEKINESDS